MEQTKKSTFKLLFYLKKNELKKNGNAPIMARITIDGTPKTFGTKLEITGGVSKSMLTLNEAIIDVKEG